MKFIGLITSEFVFHRQSLGARAGRFLIGFLGAVMYHWPQTLQDLVFCIGIGLGVGGVSQNKKTLPASGGEQPED